MSEKKDFYKNLKIKLEETTTFPTKYMFKFIIPSNQEKLQLMNDMFNHLGAVITTKKSKNGKYSSLTILVVMQNVDEIINKYEEVDTIEGVISL